MIEGRSVPASSVIPVLAYADVAEASDWLCKAFGFEERLRIGDHRAQLVFGNGAVIVTQLQTEGGPQGSFANAVHVRVEDADRHHEQADKLGARIDNPPTDYPYGRGSTAPKTSAATTGFSRSRSPTSIASGGATRINID